MFDVSSAFRDYALSPDCTILPFRRRLVAIYAHTHVRAASRSTEAFRGRSCDCRRGENGYSATYFLLDDDIRRIRRKRLPFEAEEIKTTGERERENEKVEKSERDDGSKRASEAEKDLEPWKAPITASSFA